MPYPILYSFRRCPYAMRSRMAIKKSGVICELREISLNNKPSALLFKSPKGTVPVLELSDGTVLEESLDIMRWALSIQDPDNWLEKINETETLILQLDQHFKKALDKYKYFVRFPEHTQKHYRSIGEQFLIALEDRLSEYRGQGLSDTRTTFSDIAVFPFIRQFAMVDKDWFDDAPYTLLKNWLSQHMESELFLSIMDKNLPWKPQNEIVFL